MAKVSAGLLMYRRVGGRLEVFLVHPGGPFWAKKDEGVWVIARGAVEEGEELLAAAKREFVEETGFSVGEPLIELGEVRQKSGKRVHGWAFEGDCEPGELRSNTFKMEWPPRSGKWKEFPEVDRGSWFGIAEARGKILGAEAPFLERLVEKLREG